MGTVVDLNSEQQEYVDFIMNDFELNIYEYFMSIMPNDIGDQLDDWANSGMMHVIREMIENYFVIAESELTNGRNFRVFKRLINYVIASEVMLEFASLGGIWKFEEHQKQYIENLVCSWVEQKQQEGLTSYTWEDYDYEEE